MLVLLGITVLRAWRCRAEIITIVAPFFKCGLASLDFVFTHSDDDLVANVFLGQSNSRVDLDHDVILPVDQERPGLLDVFGSDVLDKKHGLLGLNSLNLHQDAALPETCNFRVFVHVLTVLSTIAQRSTVDVLPEVGAIFKANDVLGIQVKRADHII